MGHHGHHGAALGDEPSARRVIHSESVYTGRIWDVVQDTFELSDGAEPLVRDYIDHPGAVAILVMDEEDRVLLVRQYRHPVGMALWEIPAGLLDIAGEDPLDAAARELAEEADLRAGRWAVLAEIFNTPGSSSEALRIYLARDPQAVPEHERFERTEEEAEMQWAWVPLQEAVQAVLAGRIHNVSAVAGVLAAAAARANGFSDLRPADTPWNAHPRFRASGG
ncbi:NUDIX domain-containing protein [Arthrobacter sp.]|uniref:NUDIX domain-containing protein n=1 Tax=Arthrobacter sp. TaxID=1667 RepID=UPI003A936936